MNTITIKKIAADLNLSITTISFIINGKGDQYKISKATQERVQDYIASNGFQPSSVARTLSTGKSFTVGYLVPDISNPFYADIGKCIEGLLFESGYHLFMSSTEEDPALELNLAQSMIQRQIDGMILAPASKDTLRYLKKTTIPLVTFDRRFSRTQMNFVGIDNFAASKNAISEFLDRGTRREMLIISITPDVDTIKQRIEGCISAFAERGIAFPPERIIEVDYRHLQASAITEIAKALERDPKVNCIYFTNNLTSYKGFYALLLNHRKRLETMSLVGFDDFPFYEMTTPMISGIEQPKNDIANACVQLLRQQMQEGSTDATNVILPVKMRWR